MVSVVSGIIFPAQFCGDCVLVVGDCLWVRNHLDILQIAKEGNKPEVDEGNSKPIHHILLLIIPFYVGSLMFLISNSVLDLGAME